MRLLSLTAFSLIGLLAFAGAEAIPDDATGSQLVIEIKLSEQATPDCPEKVRSNPKMVVTVGRPFQYHAGGEIRSNHGGDELLVGTRVSGKIEQGADDEYKLAVSVGVGNQSLLPGDNADVVRTETLDIRTTMTPQETKRFRYTDTGWCSISLAPIEDQECEVEVGRQQR